MLLTATGLCSTTHGHMLTPRNSTPNASWLTMERNLRRSLAQCASALVIEKVQATQDPSSALSSLALQWPVGSSSKMLTTKRTMTRLHQYRGSEASQTTVIVHL